MTVRVELYIEYIKSTVNCVSQKTAATLYNYALQTSIDTALLEDVVIRFCRYAF